MQGYFYINNSDNRVVNKDLTAIPVGEYEHIYLGQLIERVSGTDANITASGYSTSYGNYEPWKAFNGVSPTDLRNPGGNCWTANGTDDWIQYHFSEPRYFTKLEFTAFSNYAGAWTGSVIVKGSNDGNTWTTIGTNEEITANLQSITTNEIQLNDNATYNYIRLQIVGTMGADYNPRMYIDEIYVYGGKFAQHENVNIIFKESESRGEPTIELAYNNDLVKANYCYIEELGYYYYLSEPIIGKQRMVFNAKTDLRMTYKDDILNLGCIIARQENKYNAYLNDDKYPVLNKQDVSTVLFPNGFSDNHEEIIVAVNGGGGVVNG